VRIHIYVDKVFWGGVLYIQQDIEHVSNATICLHNYQRPRVVLERISVQIIPIAAIVTTEDV
jgi:hypothetical protein